MRIQKDVYSKVTTFICVSSYMVLIGLLWLSGMSLAVEDIWTTKADMPTARFGLSTCVVDGKIYAIGGGKTGGTFFSTVEEYDSETDTWTTKADMPTRRYWLSTSVVNGKIYAIGGIETNFPFATVLFSIVEEYDPATDTWVRKADMPTARWSGSASAVGGKIYAIGGGVALGSFGKPLSTVEVYDTRFVPEVITSVEAKGKLATTWGKIKQ